VQDKVSSKQTDIEVEKKDKTQFTFVVRVPTFRSEVIDKPPLPIAINSLLPHFQLLIGHRSGRDDPGGLWCLFDSGAALNVGYYPFHKHIIDKYPDKVKAVYSSETQQYDSIMLSGVVEGKEDAIKCRLPVVVEYYIPYKHRTIPMTGPTDNLSIRIALGHEVGVNTIIGMASIMGAEMSLDTTNRVICSKVWNVQPIPVVYKKPGRGIPEEVTSPALLSVQKRKRSLLSDDDADSSDEEPEKITVVDDLSYKDIQYDHSAIQCHPNKEIMEAVGKWSGDTETF